MTVAADPARARLSEVLDPRSNALATEEASWEHGYLDLLGSDAPDSTGVTQNLMLTRAVPVIYERWWRPTLAWAAKGLTGPGMAEEVRIARLFLGLGHGDRVLDVACGPANFSRAFARAAGDDGLVVGIDASPTMLARGAEDTRKAGIENLALIRGDATVLPFADSSFDCVCCFAALHLFADPFDAIDEMRRVLAPGGRIAIMTSIRRPVTVKPMKPVVERLSGMRVFEPDEITEALAERGFEGVRRRVSGLVQFVGGRLADD
jgi:ubiquinone/menaquinone biosynthesis C-methylase UbiE